MEPWMWLWPFIMMVAWPAGLMLAMALMGIGFKIIDFLFGRK